MPIACICSGNTRVKAAFIFAFFAPVLRADYRLEYVALGHIRGIIVYVVFAYSPVVSLTAIYQLRKDKEFFSG